jgi:hypothetical protein
MTFEDQLTAKSAVERSASPTTVLSVNQSHGTREVFINAVTVDIETGWPRYHSGNLERVGDVDWSDAGRKEGRNEATLQWCPRFLDPLESRNATGICA